MSGGEHRAAGASHTDEAGCAANTPAALYQAGLQRLRAGRNLDAQLCCQQSLAIDSNHADTLHLMGLVCLDANQHDHAVAWIVRAVRQDAKAEYLTSLGTALQQQGRHEEALKAFDKAVQLKPAVGELWKNLGNVLLDLKRPDDALLSFQHALKLTPRHWHATHQSGVLLYNAGRFEEALPLLDQCIEQQPNHVQSRQLRALSLKGLKRFEEALAENHRAYAIDPKDPDTCNNIGDVLQLLDRHQEALPWFDRAIALRPGYMLAINNKAFLLSQMHRFDEAFAIYEGLLRDGLNTPVTDWNLSLLYMMTGNFEAGWRLREARWHAPVLAAAYPNFEQKMWLGESDISGKTVLIHADEGLGDCIQFARYVPQVAALGARVILVVAQPIQSLLAGLPGVSECLTVPGGPLPPFDLHCPLSSLPLAFKTRLETIPSAVSYLPLPPEDRVRAWESRLPARDKLRVGLVWSGNPAHGNDRNRSIPLRMLSRILDLDATFVSLQKNPKASDQETLREHPEILDFAADLTDFTETAALVCCLDLVITVDTSVAHLAAALGRPTWILLPYTPDYRWLLDRDDSPWYPTARLFRQSARRDYGEVLDRVRSELALVVAPAPMPKYPASLAPPLQLRGSDEETLQGFERAVQLDPNQTGPLLDLGHIQVDLKRPADALLSFQRALTLDPQNWNAASKCGIVLYQMGRFQKAHGYFDLCNELQPDHAATLYMRGRALLDLGRLEEALADCQRAHELDPLNPEICNTIGAVLRSQGHEEQALPWFNRAVRLQPDSVPALTNRAVCLGQLRRFDEAFAAYAYVSALDPDNAEITWKLALLQLLTGNFEDGWAGREARWNIAARPRYPAFNQPKWLGKELVNGKTVVICADEGLGDTIQFARYVPIVAARGAQVILIVDPPAVSLLSGLPGLFKCLSNSDAVLPAFDMHIPIGSLPLAFGTRLDTIPAETAYLPAPAAAIMHAWERRLTALEKSRGRLRIGLVWSGNPRHQNDHNRSMPLRMLSRILDADATFVSLQKDPRPADKATLLELPDIIDLTADLHDFSETAALVSCLDLVISVDTSVAHLAAALGRPTWILLPYRPDYRWLLDRDDSPWYPTARLFRQGERRDYGEVLDRVRSELAALIAQRQADEALPATSPALYDIAMDHRRGGRHEQAAEWLMRAIRLDPKPEYLSSLGAALQTLGRREEALDVFDKAVQLRPGDGALWRQLAGALTELQRPGDALLSVQHALKLDPRDWESAWQCLSLLHTLGRHEEALAHFDLYSGLQPNHVPALQLRALSLRGLRRFEEALAANQRAIELEPDSAETCNNLGDALQSLGRRDEALQWFDRAIALRPTLTQALNNKAFVLKQVHRFDEAIATYQDVLQLDPTDAAAECELAQLHLLTGNFEAGWAEREARWKLASTYPKFSQPMWLGKEPVDGKAILVYADEGMGDSIQFARYIPKLAARGARVILAVEAPVVPLLSEMPGVAQCIAKPLGSPPVFDMHCPMCSLPLAFGTRFDSIPSETSYLPRPRAALVQMWEGRLGAHDKLRVGLVWSGNPLHGNDHNRSLPLHLLTSVLQADATFVSLQRNPRSEDQAALSQRTDIFDFSAGLTDFNETAALMSCLDLVITVDTAAAHLSAALGRPTWILLPYTPDYRWLLDRSDSPWYRTVRLFRQTESREYSSVLDHVREELRILVSARQAG